MTKIIKVDICGECPHCYGVFDGNEVEPYCKSLKQTCNGSQSAPLPHCPLKNYTSNESVLKKENEEIRNTVRNAQEYIDKLRLDYAYLNKENTRLKEQIENRKHFCDNLTELEYVKQENEELKQQVKYKALDEKEVGKMSKRLL